MVLPMRYAGCGRPRLLAGTTSAWGPDGTILFSSTASPALRRVNAACGNVEGCRGMAVAWPSNARCRAKPICVLESTRQTRFTHARLMGVSCVLDVAVQPIRLLD